MLRTITSICLWLFMAVAPVLALSGNVDTRTGVFHPSFKSLQVQLAGNDQLPAVLLLDAPDRLVVSFDELSDSRRYMRYELEHCDFMWRPDGLVEQMFLDGFNQADVEDYRFSQATTVNYVHYRITLPNEKMRLKVSGNYLLKVYDESNPDEVLLQARFQVSENTVSVLGSVSSRTDVDYEAAHQQLSLVVEPKRTYVADPYRDMRVVVVQNGRVDAPVVLDAPLRISGKKLYYEHTPALIFPAGNEYRRFETVTVNYPSMHVDEMSYSEPFYHATLWVDEPRAAGNYVFDKTQHGRYRVRDFDSDDSDVTSDYILTHFSLKMPELSGKGVFVDGDLTNRRFDPSSRMIYNRGKGMYECAMLLKQGSYNYQYLAVPDGSMTGVTSTIEGDFYQTVNEYSVSVYYRKPGELYDRMVGFADFLSNY